MKSTVIQMERGYAKTYVTILHTDRLQFETIEEIKLRYFCGEKSGIMIQEPNSVTNRETQITWFRNTDRGVRDGLDYLGWTLKPDWSNDNHNRFEDLKKLYPEDAFGSGNRAPLNFRVAPLENFTFSGFNYVIAEKYEQIRMFYDGTPTERIPLFVKLFLRGDGTGFGFETIQSKKEIIYYEFSLCEHKFETTTVGNCLTQYKCKTCNYSHTVDSSG